MKAIEARENTLMKLFQKPIRYDIPHDLQRPYVWRRDEQWEPLWRDVKHTAEQWLNGNDHYEHFLGATVLQFKRTSLVALSTGRSLTVTSALLRCSCCSRRRAT